jgi:hypothetical protein
MEHTILVVAKNCHSLVQVASQEMVCLYNSFIVGMTYFIFNEIKLEGLQLSQMIRGQGCEVEVVPVGVL